MNGLIGTTSYLKIKNLAPRWNPNKVGNDGLPVGAVHKIIQGGQGAGKNWGIGTILLERALEKRRIITIVTDTFENLKDGAIQDYRNMFSNCGLHFDQYYNKQDKNLKWGESVIQFRYISNEKRKQQSGKSKRRDILYINETNKIGWKAADYFISRTAEEVYYDLNPDFETWVHTNIEPRSNAFKLIVTHWDNEMLPSGERQEIESRKYNDDGTISDWYKVYGMGQTGFISEGLIYKFKLIDQVPDTAKRIASGMDYGTSPGATVLTDHYVDGKNFYIDDVFVQNNLAARKVEGSEQMSVLDKVGEVKHPKEWPIVADSAGKTEILDLHNAGYYIVPCKKRAGSLIDGVKQMRSYDIYVTRRSKHTIKGMESWRWDEDHNGKFIPEKPKMHEPDALASSRYAITGSKALGLI